jgi:hypothetical protein
MIIKEGENFITEQFSRREMKMDNKNDLEAQVQKQLEKVSSIKHQRTEERRVVDEKAGAAGKKQFAPTYARLAETLAGLRELRPVAKTLMAALQTAQDERLITGPAKMQLDFLLNNLRAAASTNYENAALSAMTRIDTINSDDPRVWPRIDFGAGAIATLGFAKKLVQDAIELLDTIPA